MRAAARLRVKRHLNPRDGHSDQKEGHGSSRSPAAQRRQQHGCEHLRGQVRSQLGISRTTYTPADDHRQMPAIERAERPLITSGDPRQQLRVRPPSTIIHK